MIATFRRLHGLSDGSLRADELVQAEALGQTKFSSPAWIGDVA
jgi:lipoate-protein ligase A